MSNLVVVVMPKTTAKVVEANRQASRPTYQELEAALKNALARIEMMEEYSRRQLALTAEVVNPWKN